MESQNAVQAVAVYAELLKLSPGHCLPEQPQLEVARELYRRGEYPAAAEAFDRFVSCYPGSSEAPNVRLLLGIIYARDLQKYEAADRHLTESMNSLRDVARRDQCLQWLANVRAILGRPAPGATG